MVPGALWYPRKRITDRIARSAVTRPFDAPPLVRLATALRAVKEHLSADAPIGLGALEEHLIASLLPPLASS